MKLSNFNAINQGIKISDMSKKLGLLVIRGSGESGFKRQESFVKRVIKTLEKKGIDTNQIQVQYIDWYTYLHDQQGKILERVLNASTKIKAKTLRKLVLTNIGDLINYGGIPNLPVQNYEKTHQAVHESILKLKGELEENAPVILVASSFGVEIMNNYIWDRQHAPANDPLGASAFERLETMVGYFMFGSTLAIFASSNDVDSLQPITFPSPNLDDKLKSIAMWESYYDKNDPLGYPVKPINANYEACNLAEFQINVGNPLTSWNIVSHFGYWKSGKLVKQIALFIEGVLAKI